MQASNVSDYAVMGVSNFPNLKELAFRATGNAAVFLKYWKTPKLKKLEYKYLQE